MSSGRKVDPPTQTTWTRHEAGTNKLMCPYCKVYATLQMVGGKSAYKCPRCRRNYSAPTKRSS